MTRKIAFLILLSVVLNVCPCYAEKAPKQPTKDTPGTAIFVMAVPVEIQVDKEKDTEEEDRWTVQLNYPVISGLQDKKAEKKINQLFKKHGQDLKRKFIKNRKQDKSKTKYELISQYAIKETKSPYFSVVFLDYKYEGGAHGTCSYHYINIDLQNNSILTLNQLFNNKATYKEDLQSLLLKQIEKRADATQMLQDEIYANLQVQKEQNFYIRPSGDLVLVFNLKEVTPYTTGMMEFVFSKEDLQSVDLPSVF
nr:DUF3298 and DUF4163 domain-containing protein [uncultured Niameybacter sp.]